MHVHVTCRVPVVRVARPATHPFDLPGRSGGGRGSKHPFHRSSSLLSSLLSTFGSARAKRKEVENAPDGTRNADAQFVNPTLNSVRSPRLRQRGALADPGRGAPKPASPGKRRGAFPGPRRGALEGETSGLRWDQWWVSDGHLAARHGRFALEQTMVWTCLEGWRGKVDVLFFPTRTFLDERFRWQVFLSP